MKTVIGIDNGTQSTKVIFYNYEEKTVVASASRNHGLVSREDGTKEQKASWWIRALRECFAQIPEAVKKTAVAVGVSGQQHGFVPLDEKGEVLYNVKLWCDTTTVDECGEIENRVGSADELFKEGGNRILPGYTASKILWLKKNQPDTYEKMRHILLPHDYINFYLTGRYTMEYGDASGTGLLDVRNRKWNRKIIKALDPQRDLLHFLPRLLEADEPAGRITVKAAEELGLPEGILVSSGGGDNMMGAVGTGTVSTGMMTMSLGTSGTIYGYSEAPLIDESENIAAFCSSTGGWLPLLCTMNCTVGTELTRSLFDVGVKEFDAEAAKAPAGSGGVITLPFFTGERTPNLPNGRGCFVGMTDTNMKKENIFRSTMESAVLGMRLGLETFRDLGFAPREIRITGGGANSPLWRQITADILNLPVIVPVYKEAAALGAGLQALWSYLRGDEKNEVAIEAITEEHVVFDEESRCIPDSQAVVVYDEVYKRYRRYIEAVKPLFE